MIRALVWACAGSSVDPFSFFFSRLCVLAAPVGAVAVACSFSFSPFGFRLCLSPLSFVPFERDGDGDIDGDCF